jgi:hypothetical protein
MAGRWVPGLALCHGRVCPPVSWPGERAREEGWPCIVAGPTPLCRGRSSLLCHGRAWPGYPRLCWFQRRKSWVAGPSPAMTRGQRPAMTHPFVTHPAMTQWRWSSGPIPPSGVASTCVQPRRGDRRGAGTRRRRGDGGTVTDTSCRLAFMYLIRNGNTRRSLRARAWSEIFHDDYRTYIEMKSRQHRWPGEPGLRFGVLSGPPCESSPLRSPRNGGPCERRRAGSEPMIGSADHASSWQVPAERNRADRVESVQSGKNHEN